MGTALTSSWTQRGARNEAPPAQQLVPGSEVAGAGGLGAGRLSPDTRNSLYERIKSGALFSGPGNQGLRMLFCVEVLPTHTLPLLFSPFEPLLAVPLPPCLGGAMDGGDGLWTDSPGGAICAGVGSTGAEKLNSIFN